MVINACLTQLIYLLPLQSLELGTITAGYCLMDRQTDQQVVVDCRRYSLMQNQVGDGRVVAITR